MDAINWHSFFFLLSALGACSFALAVVLANNIVRMAFYLVLSLTATAGLFFLAGADFVGSMQIMIYVGGTMVLLVFGVMLTAQERFVSLKTSGGTWSLASRALVLGRALLFRLFLRRLNLSCGPGLEAVLQLLGDGFSDLILGFKDIQEFSVVRFGEEMVTVLCVDELGRNPHPVPGSPNTPLQDCGNP